jgi:putative hydrolase of HD superfamily
LVELLYEAASIQRWNDHIRPHKGFTELDKQAHKMFYAYVLGNMEESDRKAGVNWRLLIEGCCFEFLHRIVLTDIKPPVFHRLMAEKGDKLNCWVLDKLRDRTGSLQGGFFERFSRYLSDSGYSVLEKKILKAAHYLATNWEFKIIYHMNTGLFGLEETRAKIADEIEEHFDLAGVQKLQLGKKTSHFLDLVGQLRFQQRWAQTPRIPETSVLGHMLVVAVLGLFCSLELNACDRRLYNNFFAGLFHDLPEVLTRDIISPVKRSVEGLDELIKDIEDRQVEEKLLPLLPVSWHREIRYFISDEFRSKVVIENRQQVVTSEKISESFNEDRFCPLDGEVIKACDQFAAYVEAYLSLAHGIKSASLLDGHQGLRSLYRDKKIAGIDFGNWFADFAAV